MMKGFFDGSFANGKCSCSAVIIDKNKIVWQKIVTLDISDSTQAEWEGLFLLLSEIHSRRIKNIHIFGDNQSVIMGINKQVKAKKLAAYYQKVRDIFYRILSYTKSIYLKWIPREENTVADALCREGVV